MRTRYADIDPYITKDGSHIRELLHPAHHGNRNQSLAEATVPVGGHTHLHRHRQSEEIYHVIAGDGAMTLGDACFKVTAGDTVCITPGTAHRIVNIGNVPLRILCVCSPPYAHGDTFLLNAENDRG